MDSNRNINHSNFPVSWTLTTVGIISEIIHYGYTTKSLSDPIGPKLLRITDIQNQSVNWSNVPYCSIDDFEKEKYLLKKGDLLFARTGATVGKTFLIKGEIPESVFASYLIRIQLPYEISSDLVYSFFQSLDYWHQIQKGKIGIGQPNVNSKVLSMIKIPIPPIYEQKELVNRLEGLFEKLDAGVEGLEKVKNQLKRYRQAVLKAAFTGELTKEWREKVLNDELRVLNEDQKELETYKIEDPDLPGLPVGWFWIELSKLGVLNRGKSKHRPRNDPILFGGKYPFIQTGNVKNSDGYIRNYSQTYNEDGLKQSKLWPANTLCITIAANIAESAFLTFPACFPDSIVGFIEDKDRCDIKYVHFFLKFAKSEVERFAPATAQKNINLQILNNIVIPKPSLIEQKEIVKETEKRFKLADEVEKIVDESLKQARRLRQSILREAFNGNLTKKWREEHPELITGENSARALLEKIKKEKEKNI